MMKKQVIIKLTPERVFFNEYASLAHSQTNLPGKLTSIPFENIYWILIQHAFDSVRGILTVEVADYFPRKEDIAGFDGQNPKAKINGLQFMNLRDEQTLVDAVRYYQKQVVRMFREEGESYLLSEAPEAPSFVPPVSKQTTLKTLFIDFKDAIFKTGFVCFEAFIPEVGKPIVFQIANPFILAEYEYIKSYFRKALNAKKIKAEVKVVHLGTEVWETFARSGHIDLIDEHLIESIKISRTIALTKIPVINKPDKSLFTSDEIFDTLNSDDREGNIFNQDEKDILAYLIDVKKVRNRQQLEYLAGKKQCEGEKLRFTLNPHFGFLFLLKGPTMNHFCWELLNSHATYIWSIDKEHGTLEMQYNRVEMVINSIRTMGRESYKHAYRNTHLDEDLIFCAINHNSVNSNFVEGFVQWKHKLEERLV